MSETIYHYYFVSALAVFSVAFSVMLLKFVRPTWNAAEPEKPKWKRIWNHVDVALVLTVLVGLASAIPDAAAVFTNKMALHNQNITDTSKKRTQEFASYFVGFRCTMPSLNLESVCELANKVAFETETDKDTWTKFADAFQAEYRSLEHVTLESPRWTRTEILNLANFSRETANFAESRDLLISTKLLSPIPWQLSMFWPHWIALGLALSLSKAVASYRL